MALVDARWLDAHGSRVERFDGETALPLVDYIPPDDRERWLESPTAFCRDVLGFEPYDIEGRDSQAKVLEAVPHHDRIAVRSGHKVGKSRLGAAVALWFFVLYAARVVLTAPSGRQVNEILWREVEQLYRRAKRPIGGHCYEVPSSGVTADDGRQIVGFSTDDPDKLSGFSGACVVYIVDEGSGFAQPLFDAIEGNRAGGARLITLGNPTQVTGEFFEAFHTKRAFYRTFHISSETVAESANPHGEIPGLATPRWVAEKRNEWGEDSPIYQIRARGNFPDTSSHSVMALSYVELGQTQWHHIQAQEVGQRLHVGLDVARYGDDESVIQARRGRYMFPPVVVNKLDSVELAGKTLQVVRKHMRLGEGTIPGTLKPLVKVDVIGVGAGVYDVLRRSKEIEAVDINVASAPDRNEDDKYVNLRTQLWFAAREFIERGGSVPPDERLKSELLSPLYTFDAGGRYKVESKDDMKKRLSRSPDRADAYCLAIYEPKKKFAPKSARIQGL